MNENLYLAEIKPDSNGISIPYYRLVKAITRNEAIKKVRNEYSLSEYDEISISPIIE